MDREFPYFVKIYYGEKAKPPKVPGTLALETKHASEVSRDFEIQAAHSNEEIGEVIWGLR